MKFKRATRHLTNTEDNIGTVTIHITLRGKTKGAQKGNISRGISISETTVGEVTEAIEDALFGERK